MCAHALVAPGTTRRESFPRPRRGVTFFARKESNQRNAPPAASRRAVHAGALRFSANQGTAPNSLRSNTGASSPLIPLRCSARSRRTGRSRSRATASTRSMDQPGAAVAFDLGSALSELSTAGPARAKRCGCLSAASSRTVPRRTEERRVPMRSIGSRPGGVFLWLLSLHEQRKRHPSAVAEMNLRPHKRKRHPRRCRLHQPLYTESQNLASNSAA